MGAYITFSIVYFFTRQALEVICDTSFLVIYWLLQPNVGSSDNLAEKEAASVGIQTKEKCIAGFIKDACVIMIVYSSTPPAPIPSPKKASVH